MKMREQEYKEKWVIKFQSDNDLKKIAKDLFNGLIYCDRQCSEHDLISRFMPLMFMGPRSPEKPKYPSENKNLQGQRDNVLYDIVERDADEKKYQEELINYDIEYKIYQEQYLPTIGLVYEYISQAGPMCVNGGPVFMSLRLLNKDDSAKMFDYYNQYKEAREKVDNF
jgi:hypothetical protein